MIQKSVTTAIAQVNLNSIRIVHASAYIQLNELRPNSLLLRIFLFAASMESAMYHATRRFMRSQVVRSACARASAAMCSRRVEDVERRRVCLTMDSRSSGGVRKPVFPFATISDGPPASRATTGRPQAMASNTTSPNVSVTEQWTKMSADA